MKFAYLNAPFQVEIRDIPLEPIGDDEVLLRIKEMCIRDRFHTALLAHHQESHGSKICVQFPLAISLLFYKGYATPSAKVQAVPS